MKKKVVLFDLDDTLYDYDYPHNKALDSVYKILNKEIKISRKEFLRLFAFSKDEVHKELSGSASSHNRVIYFQKLIEKTHNTVDPTLTLKLYETYWDVFLKNMKLKKDVVPTFNALKKRGLGIGIVSDLTTDIQLKKLKRAKLDKYVDVLVTSEEAGNEKPHLIMFLLALNKFNVLPQEAVMVGDNKVNDILGANTVGIDSVLVSKEKVKVDKDDYKLPNFYIEEIKEVLNILEKFE